MTISTTLILIVFITLTPVQAKSINENYFIDNHIKALLNKDISPVNKLPNLKIKVKTNNNQLNNSFKNNKISPFGNKFTMHPELYKETTHLDVIPLNSSNDKYLVTAIVNQTYKIPKSNNSFKTMELNDINKNTWYCDIKLSYSAIYDHFKYKGVDYYKVYKYKGGYIKKSDRQMTCKNIRFRHCAFGRFYKTPNKLATKRFNYKPKAKTISRPQKRKIYSYKINQPGHVLVPPGYSAGRLDFTVARITSSFKKTNYISIDFGEIQNPFGRWMFK